MLRSFCKPRKRIKRITNRVQQSPIGNCIGGPLCAMDFFLKKYYNSSSFFIIFCPNIAANPIILTENISRAEPYICKCKFWSFNLSKTVTISIKRNRFYRWELVLKKEVLKRHPNLTQFFFLCIFNYFTPNMLIPLLRKIPRKPFKICPISRFCRLTLVALSFGPGRGWQCAITNCKQIRPSQRPFKWQMAETSLRKGGYVLQIGSMLSGLNERMPRAPKSPEK